MGYPAISDETTILAGVRNTPSSIDVEAHTRLAADSSQRLKFSSFKFDRYPKGRCRASVGLEPPSGLLIEESVEALAAANSTSELRCTAQATVEALHKFVGDACSFEILGIKAVKAFNTTVIIVALSAQYDEEEHRLVGSYLAEENPERGAALAVLNATNRFLGNPIFHQQAPGQQT